MKQTALFLASSLAGSFATSASAQIVDAIPVMNPFDIAAVDASADACEDFYQYACGGWHAAHPMPSDVTFWSRPFTQYAHQMDDYVRRLVESATSSNTRSRDEARVGDYYSACLDTMAIEQRGIAPLRPELALIDGMTSVDELAYVAGALHATVPYVPEHGEPLFFVYKSVDPLDGGRVARLWISPGGIGLPGRDYFLADDSAGVALRSAYQAHIAKMLSKVGTRSDEAYIRSHEIVAIETALAKARLPQSAVRTDASLTSNPVTPAELEAMTPNFGWTDYFRAHGIPVVERVNVREPASMAVLDSLVATVPLETWQAYLRWHLVAERANLLPAEFRAERFAFYGRELQGQAVPESRERACFVNVERDLPQALSRVFVARAFKPEMREQTRAMFEEIKSVMRTRIAQVPWMAPETRREALAKLDAVKLSIGHPDTWMDDPLLVIRPDDFFGNVQRTGNALRRAHFDGLDQPLDINEWSDPTTYMGAGYYTRMNAIIVTTAMLRYFEEGADDPAVRYGGLGHLLAHELIHAFDPLGRQYDADGRLRDWWTTEDAEHFEERSQCVAEQFSGYEYAPGIPVDGAYVVAEQVAELSAWDIAWEAYQNATGGSDDSTDDSGYTTLQRYLLTNAQMWCTDATDGTWRRLAAGGSSKAWAAPMVCGTVTNLPIFAEGFACTAGQPMVKPPDQTCKIW